MSRLTRIERRLMEAEYLLDSTVVHVRNKGCDDVRPRSLARVQKGLNAVRAAIQLTRNEQGVKHPTLFAGSADPARPANDPARGGRGVKQKSWGTNVAHRWVRDCEEDGSDEKGVTGTVDREVGDGLEAECWFCDRPFVKEDWDEACGLWRCPHCGRCGCDLDDFTRAAIEKTYKALGSRREKA